MLMAGQLCTLHFYFLTVFYNCYDAYVNGATLHAALPPSSRIFSQCPTTLRNNSKSVCMSDAYDNYGAWQRCNTAIPPVVHLVVSVHPVNPTITV
jgi:hypothetical protein